MEKTFRINYQTIAQRISVLKKIIIALICGLMCCNNVNATILPINQYENGPILSGVFTMTGKYWDANGNQGKSPYWNCFYLKVYSDYLVETTTSLGNPIANDYRYPYIGKNDNGDRLYKSNNKTFIISRSGKVTIALSSYDMRFGNNVTISTYWEVLKGDYSQQLLQEQQQQLNNWDFFSY